MVQRLKALFAMLAFSAVFWTLVIAGCATTPVTVNDYCAIARPILVSKSDTLTDETARAILTANETGAKLCKWKHK